MPWRWKVKKQCSGGDVILSYVFADHNHDNSNHTISFVCSSVLYPFATSRNHYVLYTYISTTLTAIPNSPS